ncbi:MAG: CoA transferase [Cellulosimicrobium cellulans]|jgi:crotonobetainyl-CoA:carnitine CoA-transferase CaiB-like acyl-CoA transferase
MNTPVEISGQSSLTGLRVIEIGTSVAAPFGAQILGDMGAEVVKIERHGTGDDTRNWAPPEWNGQSIAFLSFNRNKKSVVLDYKTESGRKVLEELVASADVLIQNLRPGALAKAGFGAERLRELNPKLIYCEMSGYGHTGPRAMQPAYDPLLQAYSGIVSITGDDGGAPARVPVSLLDMGTGMWMALAVYEALRRRDRSGEGCHVQLSLLQTALTWLTSPMIGQAAGNPVPQRLGSGFRGVVPYGAFPTSDGYVFISAGNNDIWLRLVKAIGAEDLHQREGFGTNPDRNRNRHAVIEALSARTSRFTLDEIVPLLASAGVPHSPVNTMDRVIKDEQVQAIGMLQPLPHPAIEDMQLVNLPMTFDGAYPALTKTPPQLGEDTAEVLASLGLAQQDIDALFADGTVAGVPELVTAQGGVKA